MIGALMFLNSRGDVVLSRTFRDDYGVRGLTESFRNHLISTNLVERSPINIIDGLCYMHVRFQDMYLVLVSDGNVNCFSCLQYALQLLVICYEYFESINEQTLKSNFVVLQQLIDETMDFGYPQITDAGLLKLFIDVKGVDVALMKKPLESERVTSRVTGTTPWRSEGLRYRANQLFVDVFEELYVLMSQAGETLESNAVGRVMVKNFVSGVPECQLVLGDDFPLEDVFCHPCARIDAGRTITFVPLDGTFLLMRYRTVLRSPPPLKLLHTRVKEVSKTRIEMEFGLKCEIREGMSCSDVEIHVPCPQNTADVKVSVAQGRAQFDGVRHAIIWKLPRLSRGDAEISLSAEIVLLAPTLATAERAWSRPPIKISFTTLSHTLSGFRVRDLRVQELLFSDAAAKWVRYVTTAGQYEQRI